MTYAEALVSIAAGNEAMAIVLMHNHDCLEIAKAEGAQRGRDIERLARAVATIHVDIRTTLIAAGGTLVSGMGFVVWQVLTHPHGFAP